MANINNAHIENLELIGKAKLNFSREVDSAPNFDHQSNKNGDLKSVANQFEAIFLEMLLKQAKKVNLVMGYLIQTQTIVLFRCLMLSWLKVRVNWSILELQRQLYNKCLRMELGHERYIWNC